MPLKYNKVVNPPNSNVQKKKKTLHPTNKNEQINYENIVYGIGVKCFG